MWTPKPWTLQLPDFAYPLKAPLLQDATERRHLDIIIGDIGDNWSFQLMNELCNNVLNGSKMIALHKGRYFQTDNGLQIDAGAFITGLEHATKTQAHIIGKPSQSFFELATITLVRMYI